MSFRLLISFSDRQRSSLKNITISKHVSGKLVTALAKDPFQPALELHPLSGKLEGIWAASLTYKYRVTLTLMITEKEIILLDIGTHDEVYNKK